MSSNDNNANLFETTVNLDVDSPQLSPHIDNICKNVSNIFTEILHRGGLPGVDNKLLQVNKILLTLSIVNDDFIIELNEKYRGKNKMTDVLSFPVHDDLRQGLDRDFIAGNDFLLGDIFICHSVAIAQSKKAGITLETEIAELLIHGILHLIGFDHEISLEEQNTMYKLEEKIFDLYKEIQ